MAQPSGHEPVHAPLPCLDRGAGARANGTPFISFFTPREILTLARGSGFKQVEHVSADMLAERYFANRTDGLRPPSNSEELLVATNVVSMACRGIFLALSDVEAKAVA